MHFEILINLSQIVMKLSPIVMKSSHAAYFIITHQQDEVQLQELVNSFCVDALFSAFTSAAV